MRILFKKILKEKESWGLFLGLLAFFVFFQLKTVYGGDSGDFLSAAAVWGIPHPPGYPLYAFLAAVLHNLFSFSTPAFRVAFLSSIPGALAIVFLYKTLSLVISKKISLIFSLFLAFCYPFWLYSEAVEVFSLNNFFIVILGYLLLSGYFKLFFLFLGLSFSHHHIIIFLMPGIYFIFKKKKLFEKILSIHPRGVKAFYTSAVRRHRLCRRHGAWFFLGLLPYVYLPLAALKNPAVNWGNPVNLKSLVNLVTRRGYGTFVANKGILNDFTGRFLNILGFFRFVLADFSLIGVVLILIGILSIFFIKNKKQKLISWYFLICLLSYVFFIFYASFNIFNDFNVATFERFLLAPYIFLTAFMAYGLDFIYIKVKKLAVKNKNLVSSLFPVVFFAVLPFSQLIKNYPKISILKNDFTAEDLARDVLGSVEEGGVIFSRTDTTHFNSQYLFYSLDYRKDKIKYVSVFGLPAGYYQDYLKKAYPELKVNEEKKDFYDWQAFLEENYNAVPIYSIPAEKAEGYQSIPTGLLFRYYKKESTPSAEKVIEINDRLWKDYHNPLSGSLSKYKNLFLSDVVNYYQNAAKSLGEYLIDNKKWDKAEEYLKKALGFKIEDLDVELLLGRVYLGQKKCQEAEKQFKKAKKILPDNPFPDAYLRQVYLNCYQDEEKAREFLDACLGKEEEKMPKLKDL